MPDVYNRMQAGTKATTLGSIFFLLGIAVANPAWSGRIVLLILFIVFTNPISSHALIRAAHFSGSPLAAKTVKDDLAETRQPGGAAS
jgi:multicomponent Na+:H+ antiporter subunit G